MVLIIEPSKELSRVVSQALKKAGVESKQVHSSEQAILAVEDKDLQAIIIEPLIPKHNGLEFIYEFRSYGDWFDIPIIIYSQLSSEEFVLNPALKKDLGIFSHLYKPTTTLEKLVSDVQGAISK
jgi:DNA-binding response OmpR family regulator